MKILNFTVVVILALLLLPTMANAEDPVEGAVELVAEIPAYPGFPEGVLIKGNRIMVSGPAQPMHFDNATITVFNRVTGELDDVIIIPPNPYIPPGMAPNALSVMYPGSESNILVLSTHYGLLKVDIDTGVFVPVTPYGFPDLPPCYEGLPGDCSPSLECSDPMYQIPGGFPCFPGTGRPPMVNSIACRNGFGCLVTDTMQETIWLIPEGGDGTPVPWFQSATLQAFFGANGITITKEDNGEWFVYFAVLNAFGSGGMPKPGAVYRLPLIEAPEESDLELIAQFGPFDGVDEILVGDEHIFATLAFANAVVKFDRQGNEIVRYYGDPANDEIPLFSPAGLTWNNKGGTCYLNIANHGLPAPTGNTPPQCEGANCFAVLKMFVGECGSAPKSYDGF